MLSVSVTSIACLSLNNPKPRTTIITKLAEHHISNTEACLAQGYVSDTAGDEEQKPHGDQTHSTHRRMVGKWGGPSSEWHTHKTTERHKAASWPRWQKAEEHQQLKASAVDWTEVTRMGEGD